MAKQRFSDFENEFSFITLRFVLHLILFMPLLFWSAFLFPFITTKILYFRFLVEIALLLYVLLAFRHPELRPRWDWLTKSMAIFLGTLLSTSLLGENIAKSLWGTVERGEGVVTILHFMIYFFILVQAFRTQKNWYKYLFVAVISTLINAVYGLGQILNVDFFTNTTGARVAGTIGNPSFYAAYLLFGVFLSLYLIYETSKSGKRWFLWAVAVFEAFIVYKTATRGALLGGLIAFFLFLAFKVFLGERARTKLAFLAVIVVFVGSGFFVYSNRDSSWVANTHGIRRLASISYENKTTESRLDTWKASWAGWKDKFIFGYGYENYNVAFNKYFPARIFKTNNSQIWFDRAHNVFFDVAVTSGVLGLLAYLFIFLVAIIYLFRLYLRNRQNPDVFKYIILFLALVAYFVQNLFVFDTQATYLMIFLVFALIAGLYSQEFKNTDKNTAPGFKPGFIITAVIVVIVFFFNYFINWQPAKASYYTTQGIKVVKLKDYKNLKPMFEKALSYGTYMDEEIRQRLVDNALEAVAGGQLSSEDQRQLLEFVILELRKNLAQNSKDVRNHLYLMAMMNKTNGYFPELNEESIWLSEQALELSPTRPQIYFELGQAYFFKKDYDKGLEAFKKALELYDQPKESHLNYLLAAIIADRKDIIDQEWQLLASPKYVLTFSDHTSIARAYYISGEKQAAIEHYHMALEMQPDSLDLNVQLATLYGELCDIEKAHMLVNKAIEINPSYLLQGQAYIRQVENTCKK